MSWKTVKSGRSKSRSVDNHVRHTRQETEFEIQRFLESYKTKPCDRADSDHDFCLCEKYHPHKDDQRRNPYQTYYSPDDESCLNLAETMYHPIVFRTGVCRNSSNCMFGKRCGRAHSDVQLRNREDAAESYYKDSFQPALPAKTVASSLDLSSLSQGKPNFDILAMKVWKETHLSPTKVSLKIAEHLWFAVNQSNELFSRIQEAAFEECLGTVDRKVPNKLIIRSIDHDGIQACIQSLLDESSHYFVSRILRYGNRIISNLQELKTGDILPSKNLLIQYLSIVKL
jgi:hypothetical protein